MAMRDCRMAHSHGKGDGLLYPSPLGKYSSMLMDAVISSLMQSLQPILLWQPLPQYQPLSLQR